MSIHSRGRLGAAAARWRVAGVCCAVFFGGCAAPVVRPLVNRQDPARFESCADSAGRAVYEQALLELQSGRDAQALPLLRRVVELCPELVPGHAQFQDCALRLGGADEQAMRGFYEALPPSADSPVPAYAKARLLESNFARKVALDDLLKTHADFAYAYLSLGRLNRGRGQLGEAIADFQRAIERYPNLLAAHLELAESLVELGRAAEARLPYENYLRGAPNDRDTVRALVNLLLYRLNKPADARPWIERLLADDPQDEAARMDRAAADWRSGDPEAALRGYLDVLASRPDNARAALDIGYLHYDALVRGPDDRAVHWPKARKAFELFVRLVRPEEGYDYFEKVLAVPYRLKQIDKVLGPGDDRPATLDDLR